MIENIYKSLKNLSLNEYQFVSKDNDVIKLKDVFYFFYKDKQCFAYTIGNHELLLDFKFNELVKIFGDKFLRPHRFYLVNFDKIIGISKKYSTVPADEEVYIKFLNNKKIFNSADLDIHRKFLSGLLKDKRIIREKEYQIDLFGSEKSVPISSTYEKSIKKALKISNLDHTVPDNPEFKKLRDLGIIDFGFREINYIDKSNKQKVEEYKEKFDIKRFSKEKMLKYFRKVTVNEIDKVDVIKNIIWQLYRWICWGIKKKVEGNIRSLWYEIKAVLAYHSNIFEPNDVDTYYETLTKMIERDKLFKYKDFGFFDMNAPYRKVGALKPEIILASEKAGHFYFIKRLSELIGSSFICLRGEPSHISIEYFSDELKSAVRKKDLRVFIISDIDPAGYSIQKNCIKKLIANGLKIGSENALVKVNDFQDDEILIYRFPVIRYRDINGELVPFPPSTKSQLTKSMTWLFKYVKDERLFSKEIIDGKKVFTIYGIESDAADRELIKERFLDLVGNKN